MQTANILVIDDEPGLRDILTRVLTEEGYEVFSADSGEAAIGLVKTTSVDLALVDLKMPGIDGIQTIRRIKEIDRSIISVIITAYGQMESVKDASELGVYDYITKPFDLEYVKALVRHLLAGVKIKALPFSEDLEKTLSGELTQRQAMAKKFTLLKDEAHGRAEAIKFTLRDLDNKIANLYGSFADLIVYKIRTLVDNLYFKVVAICIIVGALFSYFYTARLTRQLSEQTRTRPKNIAAEDVYERLGRIEEWIMKEGKAKKDFQEGPQQ